MIRRPPRSTRTDTLFPYTTLFRSMGSAASAAYGLGKENAARPSVGAGFAGVARAAGNAAGKRASSALGLGEAALSGRQAAWNALHNSNSDAAQNPSGGEAVRSEERRVGKECVSTSRSRWSP